MVLAVNLTPRKST